MGLRSFGKSLKDGLIYLRAYNQFQEDTKMNYSGLKSLKAGLLQIVHLIAATVIGAMLDALQAVLTNKTVILERLQKADVNDAYAAALFLATSGLARVIENWRKHSPTWKAISGEATKAGPLALLLLLLPLPAAAQTSVSVEGGLLSTLSRGEKDERGTLRLLAHAPFTIRGLNAGIAARVDIGGSQDGGNLDVTKPETFRSIELLADLHVTVHRAYGLGLVAFGGASYSIEGSVGAPVQPRLYTAGGGLRVPIGNRGWVIGGLGLRQAVGGAAAMLSASIPLGEKTQFIFDGALPLDRNAFDMKTWEARTGATYTTYHKAGRKR